MNVETRDKLCIALFLITLSIGYSQEMGREYISDHQQYYKGLIAAKRGFCQLANANFEAFNQSYKGVSKEYWEERTQIKKLNCDDEMNHRPIGIAFSNNKFSSNPYRSSYRSRSNNISGKKLVNPISENSISTLKNTKKSKIAAEVALKESNEKAKVKGNSSHTKDNSMVTNISEKASHTQPKSNPKLNRVSGENIPIGEAEISKGSTNRSHHFRVKFATRKDADYEYISLAELGPIYSEKNPVTQDYDYFIGNFTNLNDAQKLGSELHKYEYSNAVITEYDKGVVKQLHTVVAASSDSQLKNMQSCIIIIGSFIVADKAFKLGAQVKRDGYKPFSETHKGFHRIGVEFDCENDNLDNKLLEMRSKYSFDAWIRK